MQFIIRTEKDVKDLQGKFVLQVNTETPDRSLLDMDWTFAKGKRLKIVSGFGFVDLYGERTDYQTFEKFKNVFNHYLFDHMIEKGKAHGGRFHRLLTSHELDFLIQRIKEENY